VTARAFSFALTAALALTGCNRADPETSGSSVTMKLPPPRPAEARPGFSSLSNTSEPEQAQ